jgi:mRNA-degrading endonuclease RelE of RelBE toxin-antitoxin system
MTPGQRRYEVALHRKVQRFLKSHHELAYDWGEISRSIAVSPRRGGQITHLKGRWHCDYRWRQGTYRLLYEIIDDDNIVHVYEANTRGDVYR